MVGKDTYGYNMPLTLEKHLENLAQEYPAVQEIGDLWRLLKKRLEEELIHSVSVFVNYSLHDKSHCCSVVQAVERFLGGERIRRMSATDTFMLLACIYAHDYGMAQTFHKVYDILGSSEFSRFLEDGEKDLQSMENEDAWALHNLFQYLKEEDKTKIPLNDIYFSIMLVIQLYLRPVHWKGVKELEDNFGSLFRGYLKKRFLYGSEGLVEICMCHGGTIEDLFRMSYRADGMAGDEYHPRFVAAMLRLGDLLDLDNDRFPSWFAEEIARNKSIIPRLSVLHFRKHEAISHLLITPERIEITAKCDFIRPQEDCGGNRQKEEVLWENAQKDSYDVAALVYDWTQQVKKECRRMTLRWNEIVQQDFGLPPAQPKVKIYVGDREYMAENRALQMKMSQERVMKLLEGTSIYKDKYVGIREMIQNAVDASLLQLWSDLMQNRYSYCGLAKNRIRDGLDLFDFLQKEKAAIFSNYDIKVEVIEDRVREKVLVVVKDKGIGITAEDVGYIADIGSSKEDNRRVQKLMGNMPEWLKPSGVFGIGLQSVFQLTDCIDFYSRQHNEPERHISLYSYGKNRGKIETKIISESNDELYFDNAVPGTNVRISIDERKFFDQDGNQKKGAFEYYDPEFDVGERLHMLYVEICRACRKKIAESKFDYFNVCLESITIEKDGKKTGPKEEEQRYSYIMPNVKRYGNFGEHLQSFRDMVPEDSYFFDFDKAFFWDRKACRCYRLSVRPCKMDEQEKRLVLPDKVQSLYDLSYKFNRISNAETIYAKHKGSARLHAGFLKLEVLILDDKPMDYMNIDRDRLKEDAVDEDGLLAVRDEIVRNWCRYLCETEERVQNGGRLQTKRPFIHYHKEPGVFVSLMVLFYQSVSEKDFEKFRTLYYETTGRKKAQGKGVCAEKEKSTGMGDEQGVKLSGRDSMETRLAEYVLENETFPVPELWKQGKRFRTRLPLSGDFAGTDDRNGKEGDGQVLEMQLENFRRLPHRLVNIKEVYQCGNDIWYEFCLQSLDREVRSVRMGDGARLYDYISVMEPQQGGQEKMKYDSLIKKVFKPDHAYGKLLAPCFPHTFRKGKNMDSDLDYCMDWYILSPFDEKASQKLASWFRKPGKEDVAEFVGAVMAGKQMEKCVSYLIKKRYGGCADEGQVREEIKEEYERFLKHFCRLVLRYRDWRAGEN